MSATSSMPGIKRGISLLAFGRNFKSITVAPFVNKETGESFQSLVCEDALGDQMFVNISQNLEEARGLSTEDTVKYIRENKAHLQVVELETGRFSLAKKGHIDTSNGIALAL